MSQWWICLPNTQGGAGVVCLRMSQAGFKNTVAEYRRIYLKAPKHLAKSMELAKEKGASALVTTLPLQRHGFTFPCKRDFRDLLCLRYNRPVLGLPSTCRCGEPYTVEHSQQCLYGGFIHQRHNEAQELFAFECHKRVSRTRNLSRLSFP